MIIHLSKNDLDPKQQIQFCFVVSNDEFLWPCSSLTANNEFHRSIVIFFLFKNDVLVFTRET